RTAPWSEVGAPVAERHCTVYTCPSSPSDVNAGPTKVNENPSVADPDGTNSVFAGNRLGPSSYRTRNRTAAPDTFADSRAVTWPWAHTCTSVSLGTLCQVVLDVLMALLRTTLVWRSSLAERPDVIASTASGIATRAAASMATMAVLLNMEPPLS